MRTRLPALAVALGFVLFLACTDLSSPDSSVFHVFFWLLVAVAVTGVGLWPTSGRDQRVELELERLSWADHIDVHAAAKPAIRRSPDVSRPPRTV